MTVLVTPKQTFFLKFCLHHHSFSVSVKLRELNYCAISVARLPEVVSLVFPVCRRCPASVPSFQHVPSCLHNILTFFFFFAFTFTRHSVAFSKNDRNTPSADLFQNGKCKVMYFTRLNFQLNPAISVSATCCPSIFSLHHNETFKRCAKYLLLHPHEQGNEQL